MAPSPPKAGLSRAPSRQPEKSMKGADHGPGVIIPEKNCTQCVVQEELCHWEPTGCTWSCRLCQQLKKLCWQFEETVTEGKWRVEGERGARKRLRVMVEEMEVQVEETERAERRWKEDSRLQVGAKIARAIWQLNDHLTSIVDELAVSQEATVVELRLLHQMLTRNLWPVNLALGSRRGQEEGESEVEGSGEVERSEEWVEEQVEGTCKNEHIKNNKNVLD